MRSILSKICVLMPSMATLLMISLKINVCFGRELTKEDFDEMLDSKYYLFVKFYAPKSVYLPLFLSPFCLFSKFTTCFLSLKTFVYRSINKFLL